MSAPIRGNGGAVINLTLTDGGTGKDVDDDVKQIRITSEDKDDSDLTFADAASGDTKDYSVELTARQSTAAASLWRMLWDNPGGVFNIVYGPHGNVTPSADKPHFTFTAKADGQPEVGGEATREKTGFEFEYTMLVTSPIVLDEGAA